MPRRPRLYLPGFPSHVIQRGNNRASCFFSDSDRVLYLHWLAEAAARNGCAIHAYVLMSNHVHILVTPSSTEGIPLMLQSLGRRYVQYVNRRQHRTGTLWEGRPHASLVDSERYLLTCGRYVEMNPVRAGMVAQPQDYRWSSHRSNAFGQADPLLRPHNLYMALGHDPASRQAAYRELFNEIPDYDEITDIRDAANRNSPLATVRFRRRLAESLASRDSGTPFVG